MFWNSPPYIRKFAEAVSLGYNFLGNLFGVVLGIVCDTIMDGTEIGRGGRRPDYHASMSRLSASVVTVSPCSAAS